MTENIIIELLQSFGIVILSLQIYNINKRINQLGDLTLALGKLIEGDLK